jgi:type II secretory pathway component GspD/PulD (secretin)
MNFQSAPTLIPVQRGPDYRFIVLLRREGAGSAARSVSYAGVPAGCLRPRLRPLAYSRSRWGCSGLLLAGLALGICWKPAALAQTSELHAPAGLYQAFTVATPGAAGAGTVTNGISLNFHGAPPNLVLEYLSDAAGFVINLETEVREPIDLWSGGPVTKDQAISLLNSSLKPHGYAVIRQGRILTVVSLDRAKTADLEVVTGNDPDAVAKSDEMVTQIIPVRFANVGQLVNNLGPLLPASTSLSANESANALILVSTRTDVRRMLQIIAALDSSIARISSIKVFPLLYADAGELATVVQQLFASEPTGQSASGRNAVQQFFNPPGAGGFGPPGSPQPPGASASSDSAGENAGGAKVVAVADERSNCLIVCAPAGLIPIVAQVVQRLDQPVNDTTDLRVFRLRNADAGELAEQLSQLFPEDAESGSTADQAGFSFGGPPLPGSGFPDATPVSPQTDGSERKKKLGRVLAVADPRTSSLLVSAASTLMPQIAALIERLDANPGLKEVVSFHELRNADPQDVKQVLQDLFNRNTTMQDNNNNNPLLGQNNPLTIRQTQKQTSTTTGSSKMGSSPTSGGGGSAGGF